MIARLTALALMALPMSMAGQAGAQTLGSDGAIVKSPILTVDSERLFLDSDFGRLTVRDIEAKSAELAAENRRIEAELGAEEKDLTDKRAAMVPAEFRVLADAFDAKVQATRRAQEAKGRALNQELEDRRVQFLNAAAPVLEELMRSAGAAVVLEQRSVFLSATAIDITGDAIDRVNAVLGDGKDMLDAPGK